MKQNNSNNYNNKMVKKSRRQCKIKNNNTILAAIVKITILIAVKYKIPNISIKCEFLELRCVVDTLKMDVIYTRIFYYMIRI